MEEEIKPFGSTQGGEEVKNNELDECKKKCDEYLNNWKRAAADLINYKKEEDKRWEIAEVGINFLKANELLPILDSFEIAEKSIPQESKDNEHIKGLLQIKNQLLSLLKKMHVSETEVIGKKFDTVFHESLGEEVRGGIEPGIVIEELRKGYKFKEHVLRPAQVK